MISLTRVLALANDTSVKLEMQYKFGTWYFHPFPVLDQAPSPLGTLVATMRHVDEVNSYEELIKPANRYLFINDFSLRARGRGLGSAMLQILAEVARTTTPVCRIEGSILGDDWNHVDQLERFYSRHGYKVELNHASQSGHLVKWLNAPGEK